MQPFSGRNVLVLEDEILIAAQIEDVVEDLGCTYHGARRVGDALEMLAANRFDAAFLDLNLYGEPSTPIAELLTERGTPFVFMTGYRSPDVQTDFPGVPLIAKPFTDSEIEQALMSML